jgi:hypothetical protein
MCENVCVYIVDVDMCVNRLGRKIWRLKEFNGQVRVEDKQENEDSESNFIVYSSFKIIRPFLRTVAIALRWPSTFTTFILA